MVILRYSLTIPSLTLVQKNNGRACCLTGHHTPREQNQKRWRQSWYAAVYTGECPLRWPVRQPLVHAPQRRLQHLQHHRASGTLPTEQHCPRRVLPWFWGLQLHWILRIWGLAEGPRPEFRRVRCSMRRRRIQCSYYANHDFRWGLCVHAVHSRHVISGVNNTFSTHHLAPIQSGPD